MDDDDENTYVHEAGRNFSIPHQANIPILQENTPFIREYTIFYTYAFFGGEEAQVFQETFPTGSTDTALLGHSTLPVLAPKNCTVNSYQHIIWKLIWTDFPAL